MGQLSSLQRERLEHGWAYETLRDSPATRHEWNTFTHRFRSHIFFGKVLVAWRLDADGQCEILNHFKVIDVDLSFDKGLRVKLADQHGISMLVTEKPQRLFDVGAFVWMPGLNDVRWVPTDWGDAKAPRVLRVGMDLKTVCDPANKFINGVNYVSELGDFRRWFPQYGETRF